MGAGPAGAGDAVAGASGRGEAGRGEAGRGEAGRGAGHPRRERRLPFGTWPSPLSATMAAAGGVRFGGLDLSLDRDGRALLWFSSLSDGRNELWVSRPQGSPRRVEAVTSARSRVNEYGGGAFWAHGETVFWVEDDDQRIRRLELAGTGGCLVDSSDARNGSGSDLTVASTGRGTLLVPEAPAKRSTRYAAGVVEPGGAWMVVEREWHADSAGEPLHEAINDLAWLPTGLADGHPTSSLPSGVHAIVSGSDFAVAPSLSPDGRELAWLQWNHPDMPWDSAELWAGRVVVRTEGPFVQDARRVAGGVAARASGEDAPAVSVCLPGWDPRGRLWWCDDRDDLWTLRHAPDAGLPAEGAGDSAPAVGPAASRHASGTDVMAVGEVGAPRWVSGGGRYGFAASTAGIDVLAVLTAGGLDRIVSLPAGDPAGDEPAVADESPVSREGVTGQSSSGASSAVQLGVVAEGISSPGWVDTLVVNRSDEGGGPEGTVMVAAIAGSPTEPTAVISATVRTSATVWGGPAQKREEPAELGPSVDVVRLHSRPWPLPEGSISVPEAITFPTGEAFLHGADAGRTGASGPVVAHGLFYPPALEGFSGTDDELPPLVVRIHGGPTASARAELSSSVQFWTTRGFAVVEVNYRGSTGYGRAYRDELRGGWGELEVQDCIAAGEFLSSRQRVDPLRCVIRGGSAGGFTALEALAADPTASGFHFAAATTLYGVTDLMALAGDTHKFESRYLDGLIGPLPEAEEVYRNRSPLNHPERISSPVLVLQGLDDPVVPPSQAEVLVAALADAGIDHEFRTYEGEGHGFRRESTIVDALEVELAFYQRVLGLVPVT